jgi:cytochrome b561
MQWRNTPTSYGAIAKTLHWSVAGLFLLSYCSVYYRHLFTESRTDPWFIAGNIHRCAGVTIAVFVLLRIIWRLKNPPPDLPPGPKWEHAAAKTGHLALYFFMVMMPLTGYLGTGAPTDFGWFAIPSFEDSRLFEWISGGVMTFKQWEKPLDFFHEEIGGALLVWILIVLHTGAALYHHFRKKDDVLLRMLPARRDGKT